MGRDTYYHSTLCPKRTRTDKNQHIPTKISSIYYVTLVFPTVYPFLSARFPKSQIPYTFWHHFFLPCPSIYTSSLLSQRNALIYFPSFIFPFVYPLYIFICLFSYTSRYPRNHGLFTKNFTKPHIPGCSGWRVCFWCAWRELLHDHRFHEWHFQVICGEKKPQRSKEIWW